MIRDCRPFAWVFLWAMAVHPAGATIRYRVSIAHPEKHLFHVRMTVPTAGKELRAALPAWNTLYQVRDFAYRVQDLRATSLPKESAAPSEALQVRKLDKQTWQIRFARSGNTTPDLGNVQIEYEIFWDTPGPFSSQLDAHHAFINPAEILFYVPDRRDEDVEISFSDLPAGWRAAVELPAGGDGLSFRAPGYDALADAPIELGSFEEFRFQEGSAQIRFAVDGQSWSRGRLEEALRRIVRTQTGMMREVPFQEYLFIFHFGAYTPSLTGGMEHLNSTAIATVSEDSGVVVAAHEFFHLWNVKRIRPQSLEPVDYTKEQWTRALWFAEGVTNTYGSYTLVRSGLWGREQFYQDLADAFAELDSRAARVWQSVEESSLDAWFDKYDTYRRPEFSISYYDKGQILGVLLDLSIRDATDNHKSLDDLLRAMNEEFAHRRRYYNDSEDIRAVIEKVSGRSFEDFFRRFVSGTDEIPANEFLALAGLDLKTERTRNSDLGFWPGRGPESSQAVISVESGSGAEEGGVRQGDVLLSLNGDAFPQNSGAWLREHSPGETVRLRVRRRNGAEQELTFALGLREDRNYRIEELAHPSDRQRRIREGILRGTTD
ncbi:MAG: PDZ domain-containing protein [Candidatus Acidiferrales bacterium]